MTAMQNFILVFFAIASLRLVGATPCTKPSPDHEEPSLDRNTVLDKFMNALANYVETFVDELVATPGEPDEEEIDEETGVTDNPHMYGDLLLTPEQEKELLIGDSEAEEQGIKQGATLWPKGQVFYELDSRLNSKAKNAINTAMREFQSKSCIKFVKKRRNTRNYVRFTPLNGCFSQFGMVGGKQDISIGAGCEVKGIVQHEILHALGRIHEQSRTDRDKYVRVNRQNIQRGKEHNFDKMNSNTQRLKYDYGSVMHYSKTAFSKNGKPTITTLMRANIGQRRGLSSTDWMHVKKNYC